MASSSTDSLLLNFLARVSVCLVGRVGRSHSALSLDGYSLKVDFSLGRVAPKLGLDVPSCILPAWVEIAEVVDEGWLALGLNGFGCTVQEADRCISTRDHEWHVVDFSLLHEHASKRILLAPHLDVAGHRFPKIAPVKLRGAL
jgi:hypothetical protein